MKILGVFFTRGVSLNDWHNSGLLTRELLIYENHLNSGFFDRIFFFTYGGFDIGESLLLRSKQLLPSDITIIPMPVFFLGFGRASSLIYQFCLPFLASRHLRGCTVFKTNQMDGSLPAVLSSVIYKRPLYLRTGYTFTIFTNIIYKHNHLRRIYAAVIQRIATRYCSAFSVSSQHDYNYFVSNYRRLADNPPSIIGNYIDTNLFCPKPSIDMKERIVFVGRLTSQKNLPTAILACSSVGIGLDLIGDGPDHSKLVELRDQIHADVRFIGKVPNQDLPELLAGYRYFILPSLWEGHPKALLEAMAVGLICICNGTVGITEFIEDGVTGFLSKGVNPADFADTIYRALSSNHTPVSSAARAFVCSTSSLEAICQKEREVYASLFSKE